MDGCIYRTKDGECDLYAEGGKYKAFCDMDGCKGRKMSNADRIRTMSDEELAEFMSKFCNCDYGSCPIMFAGNRIYCIHGCETAWNEWLKKEVEE